ncbi:MAG: oligosaccharide flippase family protein [Wenzhouxiangellaceae bacterium]|nr:oligosaccharide flippase family protein [Wenzhouxiangellaceae bacterium]
MRLPHLGPIARNSISTMLVYVVRLGVQVALLLLVARYLGPEQYGQFAGIAALAFALGTLSSFGMGFLVLGESAKSPDAGAAVLARAVPATILAAALLGPLYLWLAVHVLDSGAGLLIISLIGLSELLLVPILGLLAHRLHGLGMIARSQALALWPMVLRLTGLLLALTLLTDRSLQIYAWVHLVGSATALAVAWRLSRRHGQFLRTLHHPELAEIRRGTRHAVMNFTAITPGELDKAIALRLLGAADTGLYALASRGMAVVTLPVIAMLLAALPRMIRELQGGEKNSGRLLRLVIGIAGFYGLAAAAVLYLFAPPALEWALAAEYAGIGNVVQKIALIAPFISVRIATGTVLFALDRPLSRSAIEGGAVVAMLALALFLVPRLGLAGLVWAVLISEAMMAIVGSLILKKYSGLH